MKSLAILFFTLLALGVAACGSTETIVDPATSEPTAQPQNTRAEPEVEEEKHLPWKSLSP